MDPTCGVGTIPIEAALLERRADIAGFDLEPAAVAAARANAARAGTDVRLTVADAACLWFEDRCVDRVVVNPPWGDAVALRRVAAATGALWAEAARVLAPGGRLVALLPAGADPACPSLDGEVVTNVRLRGAEAIIFTARRSDA